MKPFEQAITGPGPLVAAWDHEDTSRSRLRLFSVDAQRLTAVAETQVPAAEREALVDRLIAQHIRIGATYAGKVFVWVADDQGFTVWKTDGVVTSLVHDAVAATNVTLFVDTADQGHRGVRVTQADATASVIVEEHDPIPGLDPAYGHDELFTDTLWAKYLGEQLAVWLLVPFVDEVSGGAFDAPLTIARQAQALAARASSGAGGELVEELGPIGRSTALALVVDPERTIVALRVTSARGTTSVTLKHGTAAQLVAFLCRVTTPSTVLFAMNTELQSRR